MSDAIDSVWGLYPEPARKRARVIRDMINVEAKRLALGEVNATLKWGQASFVPAKPKTGTPIRIHWSENDPAHLQVLVNCQTTLVETWRDALPALSYAGNRALRVPIDAPVPVDGLRRCIAMALTYHQTKR